MTPRRVTGPSTRPRLVAVWAATLRSGWAGLAVWWGPRPRSRRLRQARWRRRAVSGDRSVVVDLREVERLAGQGQVGVLERAGVRGELPQRDPGLGRQGADLATGGARDGQPDAGSCAGRSGPVAATGGETRRRGDRRAGPAEQLGEPVPRG